LQNAAIAGMIYQNLPDPEVEESEESPASILREQDRKNGDSARSKEKAGLSGNHLDFEGSCRNLQV